MDNVKIRIAEENDAEKLLEIYAPYVLKTAITFECEVPSSEDFRNRIRTTLKKYPYIAVEKNGEILGYAYAGAFKEREAYDRAVETSIYVRTDRKKEGIGKILYNALEEMLKRQNILNLNACIAYPSAEDEYLDKNSVQFHEHLGYRLVGEFRQCGYKFGNWYNMVWMEKHIGAHAKTPEPIKWFSQYRAELTDGII